MQMVTKQRCLKRCKNKRAVKYNSEVKANNLKFSVEGITILMFCQAIMKSKTLIKSIVALIVINRLI